MGCLCCEVGVTSLLSLSFPRLVLVLGLILRLGLTALASILSPAVGESASALADPAVDVIDCCPKPETAGTQIYHRRYASARRSALVWPIWPGPLPRDRCHQGVS